jgi:hypothetical protein
MRPLQHVVASAALAGALLGLSATAAHADRWWGREKAMDVVRVAFRPDPPPCGTVVERPVTDDATLDIVGLAVRHEGDAVALCAHFRDLTHWGDRWLTFDVDTDGRDYEVLVHRRGKKLETWLTQAGPEPEPETIGECGAYSYLVGVIPCDVEVDRLPAADLVSVTVPRSCLDHPSWVRAGVRNQRWLGQRRVQHDTWAPRGADEADFRGPFGPRVRHTP